MTTVLAPPRVGTALTRVGRRVSRLGRLGGRFGRMGGRLGGDRLVHRLAAAGLLPLVLFVVLQPETFGITPNNLDPMFYTGLGINTDDAMTVGADHYFVTRWSAWYPLYLADQVAGPYWGRLLLRWAATSAIVAALWQLRPRWTWGQRLLAGSVLVTMPMFLRPVMTDYSEYAIVLAGLGLVVVALRQPERQGERTAAVAGVLAGLLVVANPLAVLMVVPPLAAMVLANSRWIPAKLLNSAVIGLTALATVAVGLVWFRWLYDIPNIYQPTIDFLRHPPGPDLLRSPNLSWLARFTWLYVPPFTAGVAAVASLRPETRLDRMEWQAVGLAVAQWLIQWADQFVRRGTGLELSYYWSLSFPTLGIAVALVAARLASALSLRRAAAVVAGLVALLLVGVPSWARLPHQNGFVVLSVAVAAAIGLLVRRWPLAGASVFVAYVTLTQVGAPPYHPLAYHFFDASPRYDDLFRGDGNEAEEIYRETVWFEQEMDAVPADEDSVFLSVDDTATPIQGIYHPHVGGQLLGLDPDTDRLRPLDRLLLLTGTWSALSILGPPDEVAHAIDRLSADIELPTPVIDEVHDRDLGFRLVAFPLPSFPPLPLTIEAGDLAVQAGQVEGTDVTAPAGTPAGFAVYGPYLALPPGRYTVTAHYTTGAGSGGAAPGTFDVFTVATGAVASAPLAPTHGVPGEVTLPFEVTSRRHAWEFRVRTEGTADLVVDRLVLGPG